MSDYHAPLKDMKFALRSLSGLESICALPRFADATPELVDSVLDEAARFAEGVLAPLHDAGERQPPVVVDGQVAETQGFAALYEQLVNGGWTTLPADPQFGGMGLPQAVGFAAMELWSSANLSFALCPMLSQGAIEALESHADENLKTTFLEQLVVGTWTGTMNLTEPQAGSDLAAIRTKAVPEGDHYRITGNKIFITWGDHGMAENIVHLVLARIEGAPAGVHGVSLFIVPKYLIGPDGKPGEHNDVYPTAVEHKMGIHGSPTCSMSYGAEGQGALAYLVGEENKGLAYMFTMMNNARLNVGIQGVAVAERALQQAVVFAGERVQGMPPGQPEGSIAHHPDVRRMLMLMRSLTEAARAVCYLTAGYLDRGQGGEDAEADARCALLIPIAKAWCTEIAQEVTSLGVQVHGGMGYVEETGAAQLMRDARIMTIYEGTTGIQANDFIGRKTLRDGGTQLRAVVAEMRDTQSQLAASKDLTLMADALGRSVDAMEASIEWLSDVGKDPYAVGAASFNFLMGCGTCVAGWLLGRSALVAVEQTAEDPDFCQAKITTCNFFAAHVMPRALAHLAAVPLDGQAELMLSDQQLGI